MTTVKVVPDKFVKYLIGMSFFLILAGCSSPADSGTPVILLTSSVVRESTPTGRVETLPTSSETPTHTPAPQFTPIPEPTGCRKPPEEYDLIEINGYLLNHRTYAMLEYAQSLYVGEIELTGYAITQGSFHDNGAASFGTHLGGGAVDLSVMRTNTYTVLYEDIPKILQALRLSGFAAWLREPDEVYPGSAIHIHAIAIGDRDLSEPAEAQLAGESGYFRGYSGLPAVNGTPTPDRFGGPVICQWMRDLGYEDLRATPTADFDPTQ